MSLDPQQPASGTAPAAARSSPPLRVLRDQEAATRESDDSAQRLAVSAQRGDMDAFRGLVEAFQDKVFRVVTSVIRCDRSFGEDLCQEVFLRVYKGLATFDGSARVGAWIHTIATNVAISEYRRRRSQKRATRTLSIDAPIAGTDDLHIEPEAKGHGPGENAHQRDFVARVRAAVHELPDDFRDAVVLRDMEGLSYEEIADVLDVPPGTVRSRIHRGRLLLQQMLEGFQP